MTRTIRLLVALAFLAGVAACGNDATASGSSPGDGGGSVPALAGTAWIVVTVNGRSPIPGAVPTISFDATMVNGFFGCNQGGGRYRLDSATGQFAVAEMGVTAMGCLQPGVMEFETALMQALGSATQATLQPTGQLVLSGTATQIVLVTLEHPAAP